MAAMPEVLLVNMPFGGVDRPAIGISTLKAGLRARGIGCDIKYLNFEFARQVGARRYQWFADRASHMIFAGEWMFAQAFFPELLPDAESYYEHLRRDRGVGAETLATVEEFRALVGPYLEHCLESVEWGAYAVVGFTSTFEQNLASLALAHAVKRRHRGVTVVMGGANCEGSMGVALHRHFPFLDAVFTGPADHTFPDFVERLLRGEPTADIPGVVVREEGESRLHAAAVPIQALDSIPIPDYDDYFAQLDAAGFRTDVDVRLQIETSRGCWWGQKHHCTFCGMNASTIQFRAKSPERVVSEIEHLVARHGVRGIDAVDAIMDMAYFREVLPRLAARDLGLQIFYELKANLTRAQVRALASAGVTLVQPGIESFSTRILELMNKGATALQNAQLLKWCSEFGIQPTWNLLYGFPGERAEDYAVQADLLRTLTHLAPPRGSGRLRMDRFSPHFERRDEFGFVNVSPLEAYRYIYPLQVDERFEVAYFFDYEHGDGLDPREYIGETEAVIREWREAWSRGARVEVRESAAGDLVLTDCRGTGAAVVTELGGWRAGLYAYCDQARSTASILARAGELAPAGTAPADVLDFLAAMVGRRLMVRDGDRYLSVVPGVASAPAAALPAGDASVLGGAPAW